MSLATGEFIRRFLMHILPDGFHRIRYYGFAANGHQDDTMLPCRCCGGRMITVEIFDGVRAIARIDSS